MGWIKRLFPRKPVTLEERTPIQINWQIPFLFQFTDGVLRMVGHPYVFDLRDIILEVDGDLHVLIHYIYEDWNKAFNPQCCIDHGDKRLGVVWNVQCLYASGTPQLLTKAVLDIYPEIEKWAERFRHQQVTLHNGG